MDIPMRFLHFKYEITNSSVLNQLKYLLIFIQIWPFKLLQTNIKLRHLIIFTNFIVKIITSDFSIEAKYY